MLLLRENVVNWSEIFVLECSDVEIMDNKVSLLSCENIVTHILVILMSTRELKSCMSRLKEVKTAEFKQKAKLSNFSSLKREIQCFYMQQLARKIVFCTWLIVPNENSWCCLTKLKHWMLISRSEQWVIVCLVFVVALLQQTVWASLIKSKHVVVQCGYIVMMML